jgi:succinyl-CoA synthetase alpha subunit
MSASGGMTNELINIVNLAGHKLSFALSFGGDRFPLITLQQALLAAEKDKQTKAVVYYGELGGFDEYEMIKLKTKKRLTKPIIAHIAGVVSELFSQKPQFGHAKAKAATTLESTKAKRKALKQVGVTVGNSFTEFVNNISNISY